MKIIVGLGNPGRKYRGTPHNLGFEVVDGLARRLGGSFAFKSREQAEVAEAVHGGEALILARPSTYMNLSGQAVRELMRNRPVELGDLLIIDDDVNLPMGRLRIRSGGSHGGHNGLRSVIECLGSEAFARLRIGVQPEGEIGDMARYVLSVPRPQARERLEAMVSIAADAAVSWIERGVEATAGEFNGYRG